MNSELSTKLWGLTAFLKVTQQNAASAEESAGASEEMRTQADEMQSVVDRLTQLIGGGGGLKARMLLPGDQEIHLGIHPEMPPPTIDGLAPCVNTGEDHSG